MHHAFEFHLNQLLDEYDDQHRRLAGALNSVPRQTALTTPTHYERLTSEEFDPPPWQRGVIGFLRVSKES